MTKNLKLHTWKLLTLAVLANLGLIFYLLVGTLKPWHDIDWMDVVGEGGSAAFVLAWFFMLLLSRPAGRVTNLLAVGLGCIFLSMWLDVLDEFIAFPDTMVWDNVLESAPMPIGLLMVTLGIYHWHHEQLAINGQMEKRERLFREHRLFDTLTPLARAGYLRRQLEISLQQAGRDEQPLSLIAVDIDDFEQLCERHGAAEGDAVLLAVSQLLVLNLRRQDLVCRLAGDRFVVLLPNTGEQQASQIAAELQSSIAYLAHRSREQGERLRLSVSTSVAMAMHDTPDSLLEKLNRPLTPSFSNWAVRGA